jgi:mannose-6-phosphate isomerase-like protein (cupin superfamily)
MRLFADVDVEAQFAPEKMKKNNLFSTDRLFCDVYCFEPGQEQSPHSHAGSDKIYYVVEGRGRIRIGAEERDAAPRTAVLAPAGVSHSVLNPGPERLKVLVVMAPKPS